ncbi:hypothetical protein SBRY_10705 [Actinacidiphila bryophytorum]|uniref:Uncharacterized protein n=1 Tax=Actinacidiphila bryophytorum TaxID=1436133 RepID=A0A9W4E1V2_9ACTN|nr:hypothetical protein SBRY_10705 [Actinacidiphila bryophytorum]
MGHARHLDRRRQRHPRPALRPGRGLGRGLGRARHRDRRSSLRAAGAAAPAGHVGPCRAQAAPGVPRRFRAAARPPRAAGRRPAAGRARRTGTRRGPRGPPQARQGHLDDQRHRRRRGRHRGRRRRRRPAHRPRPRHALARPDERHTDALQRRRRARLGRAAHDARRHPQRDGGPRRLRPADGPAVSARPRPQALRRLRHRPRPPGRARQGQGDDLPRRRGTGTPAGRAAVQRHGLQDAQRQPQLGPRRDDDLRAGLHRARRHRRDARQPRHDREVVRQVRPRHDDRERLLRCGVHAADHDQRVPVGAGCGHVRAAADACVPPDADQPRGRAPSRARPRGVPARRGAGPRDDAADQVPLPERRPHLPAQRLAFPLGRVLEVPPAPRRLARTLAALSESSE